MTLYSLLMERRTFLADKDFSFQYVIKQWIPRTYNLEMQYVIYSKKYIKFNQLMCNKTNLSMMKQI